ncbi:MAG: bifunctional oligoribonuclease/PAP phosphatase NrnA [Lachnospiraceae bacterium]|nr:bifunctional oligoribonuclease/PAP phosphatase NrnA [Lachnospiraceae bacterium]
MFEKIFEDIKAYDRIIIHRHKNPDGDALGSQIGLKNLIKENFPEKEVYTVGDEAGRYAFMEESVMDEIPDEYYKGALAIVLDTSGPTLISDERYKLADKTARIDHHLFVEQICEDEVSDSSFESCCGEIAYLAKECGLRLNKLAATSIYTGMVTDSGRFRFDSTTARTFEMAAFLMEAGIDLTDIYANLYADDFDAVQTKAKFVLKIKRTEHGVGYIYNTKEEVAATGLSTFSVSRGMVGTMADIKGIDIWVNFTESDEGILCELRASRLNINPIACKYGGGGHAKASGACVPDKETAMAMLKDLDDMLA